MLVTFGVAWASYGFFSSVSYRCFKCFICLQMYVASVTSQCFKSILKNGLRALASGRPLRLGVRMLASPFYQSNQNRLRPFC
jgi:hypothetical protein